MQRLAADAGTARALTPERLRAAVCRAGTRKSAGAEGWAYGRTAAWLGELLGAMCGCLSLAGREGRWFAALAANLIVAGHRACQTDDMQVAGYRACEVVDHTGEQGTWSDIMTHHVVGLGGLSYERHLRIVFRYDLQHALACVGVCAASSSERCKKVGELRED